MTPSPLSSAQAAARGDLSLISLPTLLHSRGVASWLFKPRRVICAAGAVVFSDMGAAMAAEVASLSPEEKCRGKPRGSGWSASQTVSTEENLLAAEDAGRAPQAAEMVGCVGACGPADSQAQESVRKILGATPHSSRR